MKNKKDNKFTHNAVVRIANAFANDNGINSIIDPTSKPHEKDAQFAALMEKAAELNTNYVMTEFHNAIRAQIYNDLVDEHLVESSFGFWGGAESGDEYIYEDTIIGTQRTGNPATDMLNVSPEPVNEVQVFEFTENFGVDIKENIQIQKWATIRGFEKWLNQRYRKLKTAIDKYTHNQILAAINNYTGYSEVLVDPTDLTDDQKAKALEKAMGMEITTFANQYTNDRNNLEFDNVIDPKNIGAIFSTKSKVNRTVDYLRNLQTTGEGSDRDWGLGHVISKPLTDEESVILLPREKFIWGQENIHGNTEVGVSGIAISTEITFFGTLFMESAPAVRITVSTPEARLESLKAEKVQNIALAEARIANLNLPDVSERLGKATHKLMLSQAEEFLEYAQALNPEAVIAKSKTIKFNADDLISKVKIVADVKESNLEEKDAEEIAALREMIAKQEQEIIQAKADATNREIETNRLKEEQKAIVKQLKDLKGGK